MYIQRTCHHAPRLASKSRKGHITFSCHHVYPLFPPYSTSTYARKAITIINNLDRFCKRDFFFNLSLSYVQYCDASRGPRVCRHNRANKRRLLFINDQLYIPFSPLYNMFAHVWRGRSFVIEYGFTTINAHAETALWVAITISY